MSPFVSWQTGVWVARVGFKTTLRLGMMWTLDAFSFGSFS